MPAGRIPDMGELRKILDAMLLTVSWQEQLVYQALDTIRTSRGAGSEQPLASTQGPKKHRRK